MLWSSSRSSDWHVVDDKLGGDGYITNIHITDLHIEGTIPEAMCNFRYLKEFDLVCSEQPYPCVLLSLSLFDLISNPVPLCPSLLKSAHMANLTAGWWKHDGHHSALSDNMLS